MNYQAYPAPAKINLFLHVVGRRPDGYHLLQTAFRLLAHGDTIWIAERNDGQIILDKPLPGVAPEQDLTVRAARLLQPHAEPSCGCNIRIDKRLPMGGGLGGGSSDAATVLLALNQLWRTNLNQAALQSLGLQLGADVPVFIFGRDAFAEGIGEALQEITLPARWYLVLTPPASVPTAEIFSDPGLTRNTEIIKMAAFPKAPLRNDLEAVAIRKYPVIAEYLNWLHQHCNSALTIRMTGSGSCVFAEFSTQDQANEIYSQLPPEMLGFVSSNLIQHPLLDLLPD